MSTIERDEHFRGFAKQQFADIEGMFIKWFCATESEEEARIAHDIQLYLARRAYDLVSEATQDLAQKILAIKEKAEEEVNKHWESDWASILSGALDDIETLCKEQLEKEGETNHG